MKKQVILSLMAVAGFTISLLASGQHSYAQGNPLLVWDFWKTATVEDVTEAISKGADVNARTEDKLGRISPLHWAAQFNDNPDVIGVLLDSGADIDARDNLGWTPLHRAALKSGNPDVIGLLLDRGTDINVRSIHGLLTPLHLATAKNPMVVQFLLDRGANPKALSRCVLTPVDYAQQTENRKCPKPYAQLPEDKDKQ